MTTPISSIPAARPSVPASATPTLAGGGGDGGLRKAAEQFEAVILRQLLASMRQAKLAWLWHSCVLPQPLRAMPVTPTAASIAAMRQFGIADMVERQFRGRLGNAAGGMQ